MTVEAVESPAAPAPILEGSFAFFRPQQNSLLLVWRRKGTQEDHYMPVPPMVIQMAAQMGGLTLDDVVAKISNGDLS